MRIRIAVAVDPTGAWCAFGAGGDTSDEEKMRVVADGLKPGAARYWMEAEVHVSTAAGIAGGVIALPPAAMRPAVSRTALDTNGSRS